MALGSANFLFKGVDLVLLREDSPAWKVYEFLGDGRPRTRHEVREATGLGDTHVSNILKELWRRGYVLRSSDIVSFDRVVNRPHIGKVWSHFRGHLWIRSDSPLLSPSKIIEYVFQKTERYTLEDKLIKKQIRFIEYVNERKKVNITKKNVLELLRKSEVALTSREIAEKLGADSRRVSTLLNKMYRNGEVVRRGLVTKSGREVMFRGSIKGYLYGLPNTDQIERRLATCEFLPPWAKAVYNEVIKYSRMKKWIQVHSLAENLGRRPFEITRIVKKLQAVKPTIKMHKSSKSAWIYDEEFFTREELNEWIKIAEEIDSETGRISQKIGVLHEKYCHSILEKIWPKVACNHEFKRVIRNGRISYNVRLSNGREVDRILVIKFEVGDTKLLSFELIMEFKYVKGGVESRDIHQFLEKLAKSHEYGYEQNGIPLVKQNVIPVMVAPHYKEEAVKYAKRCGVLLLHTWELERVLKEAFGVKISFKKVAQKLLNCRDERWDLELKNLLGAEIKSAHSKKALS
ncbi:MAG: hypothetical protein QXZ17_07720 [Nitrososphaerota archaeon]